MKKPILLITLCITDRMAIVRVGSGGGELQRRVGLKAAKEAAGKAAKHAEKKHAAKKHAAKKHAAKKHAEKHPGKKAAKTRQDPAGSEKRLPGTGKVDRLEDETESLCQAFHHLHRASALISLLEPESGGDLRQLLEHGIDLYRTAANGEGDGTSAVECAVGLLRAAEHLAMAGLYEARSAFRLNIATPDPEEVDRHVRRLIPRLEELKQPEKGQAQRLLAMATELLRRAGDPSERDPHRDYELTMAADGLLSALEVGL